MEKKGIIIIGFAVFSFFLKESCSQPTTPPPPLPPITSPEPFLRQILRLPYLWGLLILLMIAIFMYVSFTKPSPKHVWRKSIIYGAIWSMSYTILIFTTNYWWSIDILRNIFQSIGLIIWFPFTIWETFFATLLGWRDSVVIVYPAIIFGLPTSIFIMNIVLKIIRRR